MITNYKDIDLYINQRHYRQINSVLLYMDHEIVFERYYNDYTKDTRNCIKSIAKSITSICVGICLQKGLIKSLDEPIFKYIPIFNQGLDPYHKVITIRHLLNMTSGIYFNGGVHYHCPMLQQMRRSSNWIAHIADVAVKDRPGTKFNYKEWDIILLAQVIENAAGQDMYDFLKNNLYQPLDINSGHWWKSPCGTTYSVAEGNQSAYETESNLSARDLLKIGLLFLNRGVYNGIRIISEEYVQESISPSKCQAEYGLMWWLGKEWYGCRGYGGQNITVVPEKKAIFVMQATPTSRGRGYDDVAWFALDILN